MLDDDYCYVTYIYNSVRNNSHIVLREFVLARLCFVRFDCFFSVASTKLMRFTHFAHTHTPENKRKLNIGRRRMSNKKMNELNSFIFIY